MSPAAGSPPKGVRVLIDARPLQDPERAPTTAAYLDHLLAAFAAEPLHGESFVLLLQAGGVDPTSALPGLPVAGRRWLPPTRLLHAGALTLDPFLIRGAAVGTAFGAGRAGAAGAVFHTAGGPVPLLPGLPTVATVLDLAPWELPHAYQATPAARFGQRLRARLLRDAAALIVPSRATALAVRRMLHMPADRVHVVPLAADDVFRPCRPVPSAAAFTGERVPSRGRGASPPGLPPPAPGFEERLAAEREALGLPERYLVFHGRYDARKDIASLLGALSAMARDPRPPALPASVGWPPLVLLVGASPDDRAAVARAAARAGVGEHLAYAPRIAPERLATIVAGARAVLLPAISEAGGLPVIEALAAGTPVVASAVGAIPELVGPAGILVEPRDAARLAAAVAAVWADDGVYDRLALSALETAGPGRRTWADVALETRRVYAGSVSSEPTGGSPAR